MQRVRWLRRVGRLDNRARAGATGWALSFQRRAGPDDLLQSRDGRRDREWPTDRALAPFIAVARGELSPCAPTWLPTNYHRWADPQARRLLNTHRA